MTTTINYPYTTDTNYTYDPALIEVTGGVAKLKDKTPADVTAWATFTTDENLNGGGGVLTGTLLGSAAVSAGKLDCTTSTSDGLSFACAGNADFTNTATIRFKITPGYTGAPASNSIFFNTPTGANEVFLRHNVSGGNLVLVVRDSGASFLINSTMGAWLPTSGVEYEFSINIDITTGATRIFIDGVQSGSTVTATGTRTASTTFYIGESSAGSGIDAKFDDFVVYDTVQHTSNYTPGYTLPESVYSTDAPYITTNSTFIANDLVLISETSTIAGSDNIKHTIITNGQDRYVTGGSAANSNGTYAQSSTDTELNSDIENIVTSRQTVYLKSFLYSDDGSTTPELDLVSMQYNAASPAPTLPTLTELEGWIYDANTPISNETVQIRPHESGYVNQEIFHKYEWETIGTTDSDGFFFGNIYVQPSGKFWEFKVGSKRYKIALNDASENYLWNLPTFEVIEDE